MFQTLETNALPFEPLHNSCHASIGCSGTGFSNAPPPAPSLVPLTIQCLNEHVPLESAISLFALFTSYPSVISSTAIPEKCTLNVLKALRTYHALRWTPLPS